MERTIQRVLVAGRGEIGASVARRLESAGVEAVAMYAEADAEDAWLDEVSFAAPISTDAGEDPYMDGLKIIGAALDAGCDAVHPGIGPLARSAVHAHMVLNVGLAWIGSPPDVLEECGDAASVRRVARQLGLPVVPTSPLFDDREDAIVWARSHGGPLRVVPVHGPARVVESPDAIAALPWTHPAVLTRHIRPARMLVIGVLGDGGTHALHLGEHEASLELAGRVRVRESPVPAVDETLRETLHAAAVKLAVALRLVGVGAVKVVLGTDGRWWIHDVVPALFDGYALHEHVYGLDLVHAQERLAAGETLGWVQSDIRPAGCGLEAVLCAVGSGRLGALALPEGAEVSTVCVEGAQIDPARDPVLARVRVGGPMRHALLVRARAALDGAVIDGVPHDTALLVTALADARVWEGNVDTELLERSAAAGGVAVVA